MTNPSTEQPAAPSKPHYAGFWIRAVAETVDSTILTLGSVVVQAVVMAVAYVFERPAGGFFDVFSPFMLQMMNLVIYVILAVPYYVWSHYCYGTTLGKRYGMTVSTLGLWSRRIYVVDSRTLGPMTLRQSWVRCLSFALSYLPFGCGYLMAAFHPRKQALHDVIACTVSVIKVRGNGLSSRAGLPQTHPS